MGLLKSAKQIREQDNGYIESLENYFKIEIESSMDAVNFMLNMIDDYSFTDQDGILDIERK